MLARPFVRKDVRRPIRGLPSDSMRRLLLVSLGCLAALGMRASQGGDGGGEWSYNLAFTNLGEYQLKGGWICR